MDGVQSVMVDTTARGVIRMKSKSAPSVEAINKALGKKMSVAKVESSKIAKAGEVYMVKVKGLG